MRPPAQASSTCRCARSRPRKVSPRARVGEGRGARARLRAAQWLAIDPSLAVAEVLRQLGEAEVWRVGTFHAAAALAQRFWCRVRSCSPFSLF